MIYILGLWASVDNELYVSDKITNDELVLFVLIQRHRLIDPTISVCSINMLQSIMRINGNKQRWNTQFRETINSLIQKKYIIDVLDLNYNKIDVFSLTPDDMFYCVFPKIGGNYFQVMHDELDEIFIKLKGTNINKFNIIRYFIAIQRVTNSESKFGYLSQAHSKICGDFRTLKTYNDFLNKHNFILINNEYVTPEKKYATTFFGRVGNEEDFNIMLANEIKRRGLIKINKQKNSKKVSNTQKVNSRKKKISNSNEQNEIDRLKREIEILKQQNKKPTKQDEWDSIMNDLADDLFGSSNFTEDDEDLSDLF